TRPQSSPPPSGAWCSSPRSFPSPASSSGWQGRRADRRRPSCRRRGLRAPARVRVEWAGSSERRNPAAGPSACWSESATSFYFRRAAGRGPEALPDRGTGSAVPVPNSYFAPGNDDGPVFLHPLGFFETLPLPQAPFTDAHVPDSELHWSRPRYANVGGRNAYQAPGQVSWTENRRVSAADGGGPSSMIPAAIRK